MSEVTLFSGEERTTIVGEWWECRYLSHSGKRVSNCWKRGKTQGLGSTYCSDCGDRVKIFVSPRRNPRSSKLGRAVTMKDHDLCRRCWRRLLQRQQQKGAIPIEYGRYRESAHVLLQEQVSTQLQFYKTAS